MIRIQWKSFTGYDLRLDIDDGASAVTSMTPAAHPFITSGDDSQEMFAPIRFQTGSIGIIGTISDMQHLVGSYPLERPVTLYASNSGAQPQVMWRGYVQSATYSQSWQSGRQEIRIPVVSRLGVLDSFRPSSVDVDYYTTFAALIKNACSKVGGFDGYIFPTLINPATTLGYSILMRNFAKRDESASTYNSYITDTYDLILSNICKLFGLVCIEWKSYLCFVAPDYAGNYVMYNSSNMDLIDNGESPVNPTTYTATTIASHVNRADNRLSLTTGKRNVIVTGQVNPFNKEICRIVADDIPLGDTLAELWMYEADRPELYYTKNFLTDAYNFLTVLGVGVKSGSSIVSTSVNRNVRWLNFQRERNGQSAIYYGCSFVNEREFLDATRWSDTGFIDKDTGWNEKLLLRLPSELIPMYQQQSTGTLFATIWSREKMPYSYLWNETKNGSIVGVKYLSINGRMLSSDGTTLNNGWEDFTGYIWMRVMYGTNELYNGTLPVDKGKFVGGTLRSQDGTYTGIARSGFVIALDPSTITEKNAFIKVFLYAVNIGSQSRSPIIANNYYSIEDFNVTIENRWSELDAAPNENGENIAKATDSSSWIDRGWSEDVNVDMEMTIAVDRSNSKISQQFGSGVILSNDVNAENPHTLYDGKTSERALCDRMAAHFSTSKKILEATVRMPPQNWSYGPLQPWQSHSPDSIGTWAVLSQTIDWQEDTIEGMFFER